MRLRLALMASLSLLLLSFPWAGCDSEEELIPFVVATPEGQDTFAGVTEIRVVFGEKEKRQTLSSPSDPFQLKLELPKAESGTVLLEGLDAAGRALCRGKSPQILSVGSSQTLTLFVARLGTAGRAPSLAPAAALGMAAADYRQEDWDNLDDDTTATVFFGGIAADGSHLAAPFYYDTYFHATYDLEDLPSGRTELTAMPVDGAYFVLFGGRDEDGQLTGRLDFMRPSTYSFEYLTELDYGLSGAARAQAPYARLGPYSALLEGSNLRIVSSFLIAGGVGAEGPRCDALHLLAKYDLSYYQWSFSAESHPMAACRQGHTVTSTRIGTGDTAERVILVYGGAPDPADPVAEVWRISPTQVDVNTVDWGLDASPLPTALGPMISGHAALALEDGRILIVGGETLDGTMVPDGWLYDPEDDSFTHLPGLLQVARSGHTATLLGDELVVAGGRGQDGAPLASVEVFDLSDGSPSYLDTVSLSVARSGHHAFVMPTGTLGLLGGHGPGDNPTDVIEIYTPGLLD